MNLLEWLYARQMNIKPGLERIQALLQALDHPEHSFRTVLVGGTNGKGSTSATLEALLRSNGIKTGLFTSPHLTRFAERFKVAGQELPENVTIEGLRALQPVAEQVGASFFEIITALACVLFRQTGVEVAVMEVGMGGRFDSTNALEPELSLITSIGLDHTQFLGDTLGQIAFEKAGIMRPHKATLTGALGEGLDTLKTQAQEKGSDLHVLGESLQFNGQALGWEGVEVQLESPWGTAFIRSSLLGSYQMRNTALALAAALKLGCSIPAQVTVQWPGRMERISWGDRDILLDGAHNPEGARALVEALQGLGVSKVPVVFGGAADKDLQQVASVLEQVASRVVLTRAQLSPRSARPEDLAQLFTVPVTVTGGPLEALQALPEGLSVVAGSLYLIGEVRPLLLGEKPEQWERWQ